MKDANGNQLVIGDIVWYRIDHPVGRFDNIGIVKRDEAPPFITVLSSSRCYLEKLPQNIKRMSDEEAMLWRLENL